jgi:hypothetical protein
MKTLKTLPILAVLLFLAVHVLTACPGVLTTPPASEAPTSILSKTTEPSPEPTQTPPESTQGPPRPTELPPIEVSLPPSAESLVPEWAAVYALPDNIEYQSADVGPGLVYKLTPVVDFSQHSIDNPIIAQLTVAQRLPEVSPPLPTDVYTMTLDAKEGMVVFSGQEEIYTARASATRLSAPIADYRPVALITASQMCVTSRETQVCAQVYTPLLPELQEVLGQTIDELKAEKDWFVSLEQGIPDVEGLEWVWPCKDKDECYASVLALAAVSDAIPPPILPPVLPEPEGSVKGAILASVAPAFQTIHVTPTLAITILAPLTDNICNNINCLDPYSGVIEAGSYMMYDIVLSGDAAFPGTTIKKSRVGLSRTVGGGVVYYLPAAIGADYLPDASEEAQAVIANLWNCRKNGRCSCYFKWKQCPWLQ